MKSIPDVCVLILTTACESTIISKFIKFNFKKTICNFFICPFNFYFELMSHIYRLQYDLNIKITLLFYIQLHKIVSFYKRIFFKVCRRK